MNHFLEKPNRLQVILGIIIIICYMTGIQGEIIPTELLTILTITVLFGQILIRSFIRIKPKVFLWAVIGFLALVISQSLIGTLEQILIETLHLDVVNTNQDTIEQLLVQMPVYVSIIVIVTGPVYEECLFRLVVFNRLYEKSRILAYIVSSFLFGLLHVFFAVFFLGQWTELIFIISYTAMGLIFALVYDQTKNIWTSIFSHMLLNGMVVSFILFQ